MAVETKRVSFRRASLPKRLEAELAQVDWETRDVLVGGLRTPAQLAICRKHRFYHAPVSVLAPEAAQAQHIAIYQSRTLFGGKSGIRYYGRVTSCSRVRRRDIWQIPKDSDEWYYRFQIERWVRLPKPVVAIEIPVVHLLTNLFLLKRGRETPELLLRSAREFRFYRALKQAFRRLSRNPRHGKTGFRFENVLIVLEDGSIKARQGSKLLTTLSIDDYHLAPSAVTRQLYADCDFP